MKNIGRQALQGVKVVDFSWVGVGPLTTKYLADHGASVIRVESVQYPETFRVTVPFKDNVPGINRSGYFAWYNSNKYGLALDLNKPKGIEVAKRLIAWADIVVQSFRPGVMKRLGLDYEDLKTVKADIIMLSLSAQGQTGPHSQSAAYGIQLVGLSGVTDITGWPDRDPCGPYGAYTDWIAPQFGATVLISALNYRRKTGKGMYIDLSQCETAIQFLAPLILNYVVNGQIYSRRGNRSPYACPHGAYRCKGEDRWCAIIVSTDNEWQAFCGVLGDPDWSKDPKFSTLLNRKKNEAELDKLIESWTIEHRTEKVMFKMQAAGVPAGVVQNSEDLFEHDPQLKSRQFFRRLHHTEMGDCAYAGPSFRLSKTPCKLERAAPCLGEHTKYVCTEILGMSDKEFVGLLNEGIFK